jgi:hypothetical protein
MKLTTARVERTLYQFEAQAVPDNHPSVPELNRVFGDHTFFLDGEGLHIVEPTLPTEDGEPAGKLVKLASWQDAGRTSLAAHRPQPSDVVIELGPDDDAGVPH